MFAGNLNDPIGTGLKERAREHNRQYAAQSRERGRRNGQLVSFSLPNYLSDPTMDAFKQSLYDAGADRIGVESSGPGYAGTFNPLFQHSAVLRPESPSQRQGLTSGHMGSVALDGFTNALRSYLKG